MFFTAVAATASAVAVIFSAEEVDAVRDQLQSQQAVQEAAVDQQLLNGVRELDRLFIDEPELRPFFYGNRPPPAGTRLGRRTTAAAEFVLDTIDLVASARRHGLMCEADWVGWRRAGQSYYTLSPVLRQLWARYRSFYSPETELVLTGKLTVPRVSLTPLQQCSNAFLGGPGAAEDATG